MSQQRSIKKVVVIGNASAGKTCLIERLTENQKPSSSYKATIGADFCHKQHGTTRLQIWDTAGLERFRPIGHSFLKDSDLILITVNPASLNDGTHQLDEHIGYVNQYAPEAKILYVVTKCDNVKGFYEDQCREVITRAHGYQTEEFDNILFYSAQTATDEENTTFLDRLVSAMPKVKEEEALDTDQEPSAQSAQLNDPAAPYFTGLRMFGFLVLFAALATAFLALGGVTGGVEHIWSNIGEFFNAIKLAVDFGPGALLTDWGIGVLVASILLAAAVTGGSMLIDYYRKTGDETGSKVPVNEKSGYTEIRENQPPVTEPQPYRGPLAASQEREELTDGPAAPPQEKGWCTIL